MKKASFLTLIRAAAMAAFLLGGVNPALASPTSLQFFSDMQTCVVSGTQKSTMYPTDEGDTNFQGKGAMMISAPVADSYGSYSARTMDSLFSFNTATNQTGNSGTYAPGSSSSPIGMNITSAFNTVYGTGNWHITSISVALASNYTQQGIQPNNDDFNIVASGLFSFEVLGSNPDLKTVTYNTLTNSVLPATTANSVGTFQWNAIGPPWTQAGPNTNNTSAEPQTTYNLTLNYSLISAISSGEFTLLGVAADNQVGYLFNTANRLAPKLTITADVGPPSSPVLTLSTLANNSFTNNTTLNVSGTVAIGIASLTINGSSVTVNSDGTFSYAVTLMTGPNTITTVATDLAGNQTTDTRTITLDQTAPLLSLALSTLTNGSFTNNATLNVAGTVTDSVGIASLTINGTNVTVNSDGSFSYAVTLITGPNTITTIATDIAGNQTMDTRTITLDQTAPVLTITQPADNSATNTTSLQITGSVNEAVSTAVTVTVNNGQPAVATMNGTNFSATATLISGLNNIVITATDQAGNVSSIKRSVTCDPTSPALAVTNPSQDITTTQGSIIISGTVTDAHSSATISITVAGQTYAPTVAQDGSFSQTINLPTATTYAIIVTATNQAGNTTMVQRNVKKTIPTGDINGDGKVDISDALLALQIAVGLVNVTPDELLGGDVAPLVNGVPAPNGVIDIADAQVILEKAVGLINW